MQASNPAAVIIAEIKGGLGNQFFQYAFARKLALRHSTQLKLDLDFFRANRDPARAYELGRLPIEASPQTFLDRQLVRLSKPKLFGNCAAAARLRQRLFFTCAVDTLRDDASDIITERRIYLSGYWQSWKHASEIRPLLLRELAFGEPPDAVNAAMLVRIDQSQSVGIHVRRGDYLTGQPLNVGVLGGDYYGPAIRLMQEKLSRPAFFVFSDDSKGARALLSEYGDCVYVTCNDGASPLYDMRLLSACKHFIIANSTFGWWGAWLSGAADKIVVVPQNWFKTRPMPRDLVPDDWISLPNQLL